MEGGVVTRHVVKGPEGEQGEPDQVGPQPGLGRGSTVRMEGMGVSMQNKDK